MVWSGGEGLKNSWAQKWGHVTYCGSLNDNASRGSHAWIFSFPLMDYLGSIGRCGLVGKSSTQEIPRKEQRVFHCSLSLCFLFALTSNFLCPNLLFSRTFRSLLVCLFLVVPPFKSCTILFFSLSLLSFSSKFYDFWLY